ncbi:MAG: lysophospholipid acyltransferase family protein [Candidatus Falkowbacteria bacterium]|nr:lysophospholipid acyltransferase family protein [Candidatus Falkowbacteria bacterium]
MIKLLKNKIILLFNYFNSILGLFLFLFLSFLLIPVFSLIEIFLKKSKRRMLWRKGARFCLGFYFTFNRLKFNVKNFYNIKQGEAKIYISNHFSPLDGMFLFYILGDNSTLLTAPFGTFDLPFSFWFRKMGCIDVWRNEIEKIKFKSANDPGEAIRKALRELESGQSIILFPEGHISIFFELLYFHSGVARIAIASGKVVIPIAITDVEKVFVKEALVLPGEISFTFGNPMDIKEYYIKNMPTMKNVVEKIRSQMKRMLPKRYKTKEE